MKGDPQTDPKGLIYESYRIEGITTQECRTIFMDWALSLPDPDPQAAIRALLDRYADQPADHPMTQILREGLQRMDGPARRRGGWRGRER